MAHLTPVSPTIAVGGEGYLRVIVNFGHACLMQTSPAMNLSPTNIRRVVLNSVSAKKLP